MSGLPGGTLDPGRMGEASRLDHALREHEKLERRLKALTDLLITKQVLTRQDVEALLATLDQTDAPKDNPTPK